MMRQRGICFLLALLLLIQMTMGITPPAAAGEVKEELTDYRDLISACRNLDPSYLKNTTAPEECRAMYDIITGALGDTLRYPEKYSDMQKFYTAWMYLTSTSYYRDADSAYGVSRLASLLLNHYGVCQEFSETMSLLLTCLGLENQRVVGTASYGKTAHGWNVVRIEGIWYHTDASTQIKPIFLSSDGAMSGGGRTWGSGIPTCNAPPISVDGYQGDASSVEVEGDFSYAPGGGILMKYTGEARSVTVPNQVCAVGPKAFQGNQSIQSVELPENLVALCASAFYGCTELSDIELPRKLSFLGSSVMNQCSNITQLRLPDSLRWGNSAFAGASGLEQVVLPENLREIYPSMFLNCTALKSIDLPDSLTRVSAQAFSGCSSLTELSFAKLPNCTIETYAFNDCGALETVVLPANLTVIGTSLFGNCTSLKDITFPKDLVQIGYYAFSGCAALSQIEVPLGAIAISDNAFENCTKLSEVAIPESTTFISNMAFEGCTSKPTIVCVAGSAADTFAKGNGLPVRYDEAMGGTGSLLVYNVGFVGGDSVQYRGVTYDLSQQGATVSRIADVNGSPFDENGALQLPDVIYKTSAGRPDTFYTVNQMVEGLNLTSPDLTAVRLPRNVKKIPNNLCEGSSNLKEIVFGAGVETIGDYAFSRCGMTSLTIPDSVSTIGKGAFSGSALRTIYLGKGIGFIGSGAFTGLENPKIWFAGNAPRLAPNAFFQYDTLLLYHPDATGFDREEYQSYLRGPCRPEDSVALMQPLKVTDEEGWMNLSLKIAWLTPREPGEGPPVIAALYSKEGKMLSCARTFPHYSNGSITSNLQLRFPQLPDAYQVRVFVLDPDTLSPLALPMVAPIP